MATVASHSNFAFVGDISITVGDLTGLPSKTVTSTSIPPYLTTANVPVVTSNQLSDLGVSIANAWISVSGTTATLNIKLANTALLSSIATDPCTFHVAVL